MSEGKREWPIAKFGEVFDFKGGSQPPKSEFASEPREGYVRLLQIRDFDDDGKAVYIRDEKKWPKCTEKDIMIGRYGASVGKVLGGKAGAYNVALVRLIFDPTRVHPRWARHFCASGYLQGPLKNISRSAQNGFNKEDLAEIEFPFPQIDEQENIANKLDNLFERSQNAREELTRIPSLVERYKLAILATAFRGDSTADWRTSHPSVDSGSVSVDSMSRMQLRRAGGARSSAEAPKWTDLPQTWKAVAVDSIGEVILGRQRSPDNHIGPNMRPYVRAANITWDGWDLSDVKQMNFDERDFRRFKLQPGDVLINEGSGSADEVGKPAIWNGQIKNCCFQNTLIAVRPHATTSEYLYFVFLNAALSRAFVDETRGVNIHHIGRAGLAQFVIPLPPSEEQHEIVRRIKTAFGSIDHLSTEASRATDLLDRLDQATLAKAFRGELLSALERDTTLAKPNRGSHR